MNLKSISDSDLLVSTKRLVSEEKRIGIEVLHHLREVEARKLFASLGFSSLFSYCTDELGYSEGGAQRRITAMRLLREIPELDAKLKEGSVSVATLSKVQSFLTQEKRRFGKTYSQGEKAELLSKVEGKSTKQTERVLATISPQSAREERAWAINEQETEIRFTVSRELMRKLERLKNLMGHKANTQSYAGLIEELADMAIQKLDHSERPSRSLPPVEVGKKTRHIPIAIKRAIWKRDGAQCTYVDPKGGRRCEGRHALEFEHIQPYSKGGESTLENLKLLCPAHNQLAAIQSYGLSKMHEYWAV